MIKLARFLIPVRFDRRASGAGELSTDLPEVGHRGEFPTRKPIVE